MVKYNLSLHILVILLIFNILDLVAQPKFQLVDILNISSSTNQFSKPIFSQDSKKILVTGVNKRGLYLLDFENNVLALTEEDRAGVDFKWTKNGNIEYIVKNERYELVKKKIVLHKELKDNGLDTFVYIDSKTLKIHFTNTINDFEIPTELGMFYNAHISPNKKMVAVNSCSDIFIIDIYNSAKPINLGFGIVSGWSPDNKYILSFEDISTDGRNIINSDLYLIDVQTKMKYRLTDTNHVMEMWASFSPDGKKIVFCDDQSGQIFISTIILK